MNALHDGIAKHHVVLVECGTQQDALLVTLTQTYTCLVCSLLDLDLVRVTHALQSKRWDGVVPVLVLVRCESRVGELAAQIQRRQRKQAVIWLIDSTYSPHRAQLQTMAGTSVTFVRGNVFSGNSGPCVHVPPDMESAEMLEYVQSVTTGFESAEMLSDLDIMVHHVPPAVVKHCVHSLRKSGFCSLSRMARTTSVNLQFMQVIRPLLDRHTARGFSLQEALVYIDYAHQISIQPALIQWPRDESDRLLVQQMNDMLRVRASIWAASPKKRKRDENIVRGTPIK